METLTKLTGGNQKMQQEDLNAAPGTETVQQEAVSSEAKQAAIHEATAQEPSQELAAEQAPQAEATQQVEQQVQPQVQPQAPTQPQDEFAALDNAGQVEKQTFDPSPFIGKDSFIEFIEERKGQFGFYIKLFAQAIQTGGEDGIEIRPSAIYGLDKDNEGNLGWTDGSKLHNFLKKCGVAHYKELLTSAQAVPMKDDKGESYRKLLGGMRTQIKLQTRQANDGKEYLTF